MGNEKMSDYHGHKTMMDGSRIPLPREEAEAERDKADNALVDRYRDPKTGVFKFPGDVAAIVRRLDTAEAERDVLRTAVIEAGRAVGASLADAVSNEFLLKVPAEVRLVIARLTSERDALAKALEPFAVFAGNNTDEHGWAGSECQRERVCDWFGPSEFRAAIHALSALTKEPAAAIREDDNG